MDDGLFRRVAEPHMVKAHLTVDDGGVGAVLRQGGLLFLGLVEELKDPLGGGRHALQHIADLGQLLDGLGKVLDILDKGLDITDGNDAPGRKDAARHRHRHIAQVAHKHHDGLHQAGEELAFPGRLKKAVVGGVKFLLDGALPVEGLDDAVAGVNLLHLAVDHAQKALLGFEVFLADFDHQHDQNHRHRQNQQRDEGHFGADGQHHDEHAHHGGAAGDELGDALVQALAQSIHIVGDAGENLAHRAFFKIGKGQTVDLFADLAAEIIADFLGKAAHDPGLPKMEQCRHQIHDQQDDKNLCNIAKVNAAGALQFGNPAGGQRRGGLGQNLGTCDAEHRGNHGKHQHRDELELIVGHGAGQAAHGTLEILGFLGGMTSGMRHQHSPPFRPSSLLLSWLRAIS